jgi:hypothetical protein
MHVKRHLRAGAKYSDFISSCFVCDLLQSLGEYGTRVSGGQVSGVGDKGTAHQKQKELRRLLFLALLGVCAWFDPN